MTYSDRLKIEMYLNDGKTQREIARLMNRHYNTINYEIKRGRTKLRDGQTWLEYDYYSAEIGQQKHDYHAESKGRDLKIGNDYDFVKHVEYCIIDLKYSPYAALQSAKGKRRTEVCVTTLYHYIDRGLFMNVTNKDLPWRRVAPKQEYKEVRLSYKNLKGRSIEERPREIKKRKTAGHWELAEIVYLFLQNVKPGMKLLCRYQTRPGTLFLTPLMIWNVHMVLISSGRYSARSLATTARSFSISKRLKSL